MHIFLIGGWGMPASVLDPLRMALGLGVEQCVSLNQPYGDLKEQLLRQMRPGTLLIGWSLGGNLALQLAADAGEHVSAVVTVATTPRFLAAPDWPNGYDPSKFNDFQALLSEKPAETLFSFAALATLGSAFQREEARWLRGQLDSAPVFPSDVLEDTLAALVAVDQRELFGQLKVPVVSLLGELDHLVPAAVARDLVLLNDRARVQVIEGMAHLPSCRFMSPVAETLRQHILPIIRSWC